MTCSEVDHMSGEGLSLFYFWF